MSDSIRDDIEAALKEQDEREPEDQIEQEEELDEEVEVPEPEKNEPEKPEEPEVKEPEAAKPEQEGTWSPEKAPTSWSPKVREQWGKLPEDVRKEIVRREEASGQGVRKLQEEFQPVRQFAEQLSPFIQEARQLGADPTQYIANVMVGERSLRSQDPNEKFNALLNIADQYGIPLRQYLGGEQPPAQSAPAIPAAVQQELQAMRQWREQEQAQQLQSQIEEFSAMMG
jgi:DNA mismatch repair ATPase MutL